MAQTGGLLRICAIAFHVVFSQAYVYLGCGSADFADVSCTPGDATFHVRCAGILSGTIAQKALQCNALCLSYPDYAAFSIQNSTSCLCKKSMPSVDSNSTEVDYCTKSDVLFSLQEELRPSFLLRLERSDQLALSDTTAGGVSDFQLSLTGATAGGLSGFVNRSSNTLKHNFFLGRCVHQEAAACLADDNAWKGTAQIKSGDIVAWASQSPGLAYACNYLECEQEAFPPKNIAALYRIGKASGNGVAANGAAINLGDSVYLYSLRFGANVVCDEVRCGVTSPGIDAIDNGQFILKKAQEDGILSPNAMIKLFKGGKAAKLSGMRYDEEIHSNWFLGKCGSGSLQCPIDYDIMNDALSAFDTSEQIRSGDIVALVNQGTGLNHAMNCVYDDIPCIFLSHPPEPGYQGAFFKIVKVVNDVPVSPGSVIRFGDEVYFFTLQYLEWDESRHVDCKDSFCEATTDSTIPRSKFYLLEAARSTCAAYRCPNGLSNIVPNAASTLFTDENCCQLEAMPSLTRLLSVEQVATLVTGACCLTLFIYVLVRVGGCLLSRRRQKSKPQDVQVLKPDRSRQSSFSHSWCSVLPQEAHPVAADRDPEDLSPLRGTSSFGGQILGSSESAVVPLPPKERRIDCQEFDGVLPQGSPPELPNAIDSDPEDLSPLRLDDDPNMSGGMVVQEYKVDQERETAMAAAIDALRARALAKAPPKPPLGRLALEDGGFPLQAIAQVVTAYLPKAVNGRQALEAVGEQTWQSIKFGVHAFPGTQGLAYRREKQVDTKMEEYLRWGETIQGVDEGDGWLRVQVPAALFRSARGLAGSSESAVVPLPPKERRIDCQEFDGVLPQGSPPELPNAIHSDPEDLSPLRGTSPSGEPTSGLFELLRRSPSSLVASADAWNGTANLSRLDDDNPMEIETKKPAAEVRIFVDEHQEHGCEKKVPNMSGVRKDSDDEVMVVEEFRVDRERGVPIDVAIDALLARALAKAPPKPPIGRLALEDGEGPFQAITQVGGSSSSKDTAWKADQPPPPKPPETTTLVPPLPPQQKPPPLPAPPVPPPGNLPPSLKKLLMERKQSTSKLDSGADDTAVGETAAKLPTFIPSEPEWKACAACGHKNSPHAKFCEECGHRAWPSAQACAACGHKNSPHAKFCKECGHRAWPSAQAEDPS